MYSWPALRLGGFGLGYSLCLNRLPAKPRACANWLQSLGYGEQIGGGSQFFPLMNVFALRVPQANGCGNSAYIDLEVRRLGQG
jgi:hypothetical protein